MILLFIPRLCLPSSLAILLTHLNILIPLLDRLFFVQRPIRPIHDTTSHASSLRHCSGIPSNTTVPPHLHRFPLRVLLWAGTAYCLGILEDEYIVIVHEKAVHVFEGASGGFRVEEVNYGHKTGVEDGPDYVEAPARLPSAGEPFYSGSQSSHTSGWSQFQLG